MAEDQRTFGERVSDAVARFGGSWHFIIIGFIVIGLWTFVNTCHFLSVLHFDDYPFILLNLFLSMIAAFQAPFIMMSQNRAEAKQDAASRELFAETKDLIKKNIAIEKKMYALMRRMDERTQQQEMAAGHSYLQHEKVPAPPDPAERHLPGGGSEAQE